MPQYFIVDSCLIYWSFLNNKDIFTFRSQDLKHHDFVGFTEVTLLKLLNYPKAVVTTSKNLRTAGEYRPLIGVAQDNKQQERQPIIDYSD